MRKKHLLSVISILLLWSFPTYTSSAYMDVQVRRSEHLRTIIIPENAVLTDYINANIPNTRYIINHNHHLEDYTKGLTIGENCILEFKKGAIYNGRLICGNITIKGNPQFVDTYIEINNANKVQIQNLIATFTYAVDDFLKITNSQNIKINKVKVVFDEGNRQFPDGNFIEAEGLDITNCQNITFKNCSIYNSKSAYADSDHGSLICKYSRDIKVEGCFSSGGQNEIFNFIKCEKVRIENTTVDGGAGSAIATQGGEDFIINKCKSYNVTASGYSLNSKKMRIQNSIAKDWKYFNGITLGHPQDGLQVSDIVVSNCIIILSTNVNSYRKYALGGFLDGNVIIRNCDIRTSNICSFYGMYHSEDMPLIIEKNIFNIFEGDSYVEVFRANDVNNLYILNNTFIGGANISGAINKKNGPPFSKWIITGNIFKDLNQAVIISPVVKRNVAKGTFVFSNNIIESSEMTNLRYNLGGPKYTNELVAIPKYSKRIIANNKIRNLSGDNVILFKSESLEGIETIFDNNYISADNILDVLDLDYSCTVEDGSKVTVTNNTFLKGATIKNANELINCGNVRFEGNVIADH